MSKRKRRLSKQAAPQIFITYQPTNRRCTMCGAPAVREVFVPYETIGSYCRMHLDAAVYFAVGRREAA